jgi:hypothetical protein
LVCNAAYALYSMHIDSWDIERGRFNNLVKLQDGELIEI